MVVVETPSEGKPSMGKSIRNFATVTRVGLDLAKRVFQVHAVDAKGEIVVARKLTRNQLIPFFTRLAVASDARAGKLAPSAKPGGKRNSDGRDFARLTRGIVAKSVGESDRDWGRVC